MAAPISSLIDSLPEANNKSEILTDLKAILGNLSVQSLSTVVANVSFNVVFDCLSTDDRDQLELCCDVVKKLLTAVPVEVILLQFRDELRTALQHRETAVRSLSISQVLRVSEECVQSLVDDEHVVDLVVKTLADESLEVAKSASRVLLNLGSVSEGLQVFLSGPGFSTIQDVLNTNETIKFRVYEAVIAISRQSEAGLQSCCRCGLLQQFLNELHKDDILVQLNCLELLSDLALSEHGLTYLDTQGVIGKLETMLHASQTDPLAGFLIPGLVKFFGCVARLHPKEVCSNNETFVTTVFTNLATPETASMLSLAVQTVGFIGSSVEGKLALEKLGTRMTSGMKSIGKVLRESQQDNKIVVLQALTSLLKLPVADQTTELLKLMECWYGHLGNQTFNYLMTIAEQPFPDLRISFLGLLRSLAAQPWAQSIMNSHPGFQEYLMNRSTEKTKECKEAKYAVVSTLASSPTVAEIFGQPYVIELKVYCSQGPFWVRVQAEVAMDGDS